MQQFRLNCHIYDIFFHEKCVFIIIYELLELICCDLSKNKCPCNIHVSTNITKPEGCTVPLLFMILDASGFYCKYSIIGRFYFVVVLGVIICDICSADLSSLLSGIWNVFSTPSQATQTTASSLVFTHSFLHLECVQLSLTVSVVFFVSNRNQTF